MSINDANRFLGIWPARCQHRGDTIGVVIQRNGAKAAKRLCDSCGETHGGSIAYAALGAHIDTFPVIRDNRALDETCEVCSSAEGVEWHHYAPWHLFGAEAEAWPKGLLCVRCHRRWHQTTRTGSYYDGPAIDPWSTLSTEQATH